MADIAIQWTPGQYRGDWAISGGALLQGYDLQNAVLISLFTDARAPDSWMPPPGWNGGRRGWWGDTFEAAPTDGGVPLAPLGSGLWLLSRRAKSDAGALLIEAQQTCRTALQWLLDTGVAAVVDVRCQWQAPQRLGIAVRIVRPSGTAENFTFGWAWQELN